MRYLLIAFSVLAGSAKSLLSKGLHPVNVNRYGLARSNELIFSAALCSVLTAAAITGFGGVSLFTVLAGLVFSLVLTFGQMLYMEALAAGEVSVTAFIYSCGFLIPTFAGVLFWHEPVTVPKTAGVAMLLLAFFLISRTPAKEGEKRSGGRKWRICAFSAMTMSGILGLMQKFHQTSAHKAEIGSFLAVAMLASVGLSAIIALLNREGAKDVKFTGKLTAAALSCGAVYGVANFINLRLAGVIPATLQYPLVNGGTIVLTAILGRVFFRERLTRMKTAGILIGIAAMIVISR